MRYLKAIIFLILALNFVSCKTVVTEREPMGGQPAPPAVQPEEPEITSENNSSAEIVARLEDFFSKKARAGFNGTVLLAREGDILFSRAYGFADMRTKDSLRLESSFQLASVSKPITAIAILQLYEDGLLNIEDSVQQYLPEFPYHGISLRMLLNHRSGLSNYMYFSDEYWPDWEVPITNQDVLNLMVKYKPKPYYPPDTRYNYSNTNFAILALIVERVSKMSFEAYVKLNIFLPLDMNSSLIYNKSVYPDNFNRVKGYNAGRRELENTYLNGVVGDQGVYSSAIDLLKLDQALYNGSLLADSTLEMAFEPQHKDLRIWDNYGLGWRINARDPDNKIVYHSGWWRGFHTYFIRELGARKTLIILSNTDRSSSMGIRDLLEMI